MKKFNILILSFIFLNCDSKNNRRESGILRNSFKKEFDINEKIESENFPLIIYDTLVFTEFMKGSLLDKKIKDSQEKLHFYLKTLYSFHQWFRLLTFYLKVYMKFPQAFQYSPFFDSKSQCFVPFPFY